MPRGSIDERLATLERRVTQLEDAHDAVRSEISAFRIDMRAEFTALRSEMKAEFASVRSEMRDLRAELGASIIATNEETRRHMRVLHEDLVARIATIGEGGSPPSTQSPAPSRRTGRRGNRRR